MKRGGGTRVGDRFRSARARDQGDRDAVTRERRDDGKLIAGAIEAISRRIDCRAMNEPIRDAGDGEGLGPQLACTRESIRISRARRGKSRDQRTPRTQTCERIAMHGERECDAAVFDTLHPRVATRKEREFDDVRERLGLRGREFEMHLEAEHRRGSRVRSLEARQLRLSRREHERVGFEIVEGIVATHAHAAARELHRARATFDVHTRPVRGRKQRRIEGAARDARCAEGQPALDRYAARTHADALDRRRTERERIDPKRARFRTCFDAQEFTAHFRRDDAIAFQ